ncbi:MAG: ribonuclease Y [Trueperaceae bacterium]|nr:ribonuclease Y [Trueperaceae bacterium]
MSWLLGLVGLLLGAGIGVGIGLVLRRGRDQERAAQADRDARALLAQAEEKAARLQERATQEARQRAREDRERTEAELAREREAVRAELKRERDDAERDVARALEQAATHRDEIARSREDLRREREKLDVFEDRLTRRGEQQDARALRLDDQEERLDAREDELRRRDDALADREADVERRLHEVAGLDREQAERIILERLEGELEREKAVRIRGALERADADAKRRSQGILAQAIQRSASEVSAAIAVTVVPIPSDSMKGRIIGREGRNIRAFEALTGVDLIIDDTPEAVLLSSFNPLRREVARLALKELVEDGRIHPARIEEVVQKAQQDMQTYIRERGEEAALEANVVGIKPGLMQLLGRMHFRTSYGQNILQHSVQVAHLSGIIAAELGLDEQMARRAGLMHDIGKSIDREMEGTHTEIGAGLGRRFGEPDDVVDAIAHHHDLDQADTLFPVLINAADAVSAARPGARRESLEIYLKRLEGLETIATSFPGVEKCYAIQAGREIRIIVEPDEIDDARAVLLARDIAGRIEQDMEYPGQVQVTVVRETRAVQYAR